MPLNKETKTFLESSPNGRPIISTFLIKVLPSKGQYFFSITHGRFQKCVDGDGGD